MKGEKSFEASEKKGIKITYKPTHNKKQIEIKESMVSCVYIGKPNCCMCGCAGTYYYNSKNVEYASKDRGYEVTSKEVNDKKVNAVLKMFENFEGEIEGIEDYIFTIIVDNKQYTIYLKEGEEK